MLDYEYISQKISDMAGLPVRVYRNNTLIYFYCFVELEKDPALLVINELLERKKHIDYYVTSNADYYGILNTDDISIYIGPSLNTLTSDQQLKKWAFDLQVNDIDNYVSSLKSLVKMPLNSILQILCTLNYVFNNEKSNLSDFTTYQTNDISFPESENNEADIYRSLNIENMISTFIENGDVDGFENWIKQAPTVKEGKVASNMLRQRKNIFIIATTLFSRSAIKGGMTPKTALLLSNAYIQQCEATSSVDEISNLQIKMIQKYLHEVSTIKQISHDNYLAKKVYNIVKQNISININTAFIANLLGYSRSYLSTSFKRENNIDLKNYILNIKIDESKKLLAQTNNSLVSIAYYLGFSSPSHFNNAFKKVTNTTPSQFRKQSL